MSFFAEVHAEQKQRLGKRVKFQGNEFIYLKGITSCAQGSWVTFDEAHVTLLAVANAQGRVAVAGAAVDASTKFGWFQIYGKVPAKVLASFADNGKVYLTATPGSVDDADVSADFVIGAVGRSAIDVPATGQANFEISYPFVMDLVFD